MAVGSASDDVLSTDDLRLLCSCPPKYVSNTARCNSLVLDDSSHGGFRVAVEEFFQTRFCRVMIQNYFVLALVSYGNEESDWTALCCDAAVEADLKSVFTAAVVDTAAH